ncbi:hypothetical protein DFP93_107147 [Aneurinibacillus soli]|uniref:Uncharacterized protein n=1 Tax=Aneurinibacillus soli TaxID=1500254 RepID=A0A0U5B1C9_9BACL|nr:hypothetical protein [Aneurinibacillus soli]PYE61756.1 hypothetical protein DFP93_107147 [Aneurinibacillus soli]BAU28386.1 hypothetical protein CB4_02560 [Aneurinibacillus soli]
MKKKLIGGMMAVAMVFSGAGAVSAAGVNNMNSIDLNSIDLETALMQVQSQRAQLLDTQLKNKLEEVQKRNAQITQLNEQLKELRNNLSSTTDEKQREELQKQIEKVKSQIDSLSSTQQMDMLRLQSMSNKRNEAFDVMTNFIKKMQDSRSSIIGNMR